MYENRLNNYNYGMLDVIQWKTNAAKEKIMY